MSRNLAGFGKFQKRVYRRLLDGEQEYGDSAFTTSDHLRLVQEIREELADITGWSYLLDCRLERIEHALSEKWCRDADEAARSGDDEG